VSKIEKVPAGFEAENPFKPANRKCTDVLCMLFFVLFWIGMAVISIVSYTKGKPERFVGWFVVGNL
jgi:hypothetical protein